MRPTFFPTPAALRKWLAKHHASERELLVGYYKKGTGRPSITWPESVDEALCFGWIDGVRRRVDESSYTIRFTPRRRGSIWSAVNISRAEELRKAGRMQAAGLAAFQARTENKSGIYAYEQREVDLPEPYRGLLQRNEAAWRGFQAETPSNRKKYFWFIVSAKKEETRLKRLNSLIARWTAAAPTSPTPRKRA